MFESYQASAASSGIACYQCHVLGLVRRLGVVGMKQRVSKGSDSLRLRWRWVECGSTPAERADGMAGSSYRKYERQGSSVIGVSILFTFGYVLVLVMRDGKGNRKSSGKQFLLSPRIPALSPTLLLLNGLKHGSHDKNNRRIHQKRWEHGHPRKP